MRAHPVTIAINIAENTVLVLHGSTAEVFGQGGITVFELGRGGNGPAIRLKARDRRELVQ